MVPSHALEAAAGQDRGVERAVRAVHDDGRDVVGGERDGRQVARGLDGDAVALVGADEPGGRVGGVGLEGVALLVVGADDVLDVFECDFQGLQAVPF